MPAGTDYFNPTLSVDDAWDAAAYVVSQPRPQLAGLEKDFPDRLLKAGRCRLRPLRGRFSERQHKYGPFAPIRAEIKRLQQKQKGG